MGPRNGTAKDTSRKGADASASMPSKTNSENRKLRNRLSQKAFRARQAMRIKELEDQVNLESNSDAARTAQLRDQNTALRNQLLNCHKKITSLQISMNTLAETTALALGLETPNHVNTCSNPIRCKHSHDDQDRHSSSDEGYSSHTLGLELAPLEEACGQDDPVLNNIQTRTADSNMDKQLPTHVVQIDDTRHIELVQSFLEQNREQNQLATHNLDFYSPPGCFNALPSYRSGTLTDNSVNSNLLPIPQFSPSFLFKDIGFQHYADLVDRSPPLNSCAQTSLRRTNSLFSDHVSAVEYFLQQKWLKRCPNTFNEDQFTESIKFMLSAFVSTSWQAMTAWHTYTKAHIPLKDLTAWRIVQTPENYMKIIPSYRPTKLQISTPHPAIIDWIPWSALRDKLILYHSSNPCLDELICDIGNSYVVPCDLSNLVANLPVMVGYVSVWDLVRAIAPDATSPDSNASDQSSTDFFAASSDTCAYNPEPIETVGSNVDDIGPMYSSNITLPARDKATLFGSETLAIQAFKALGMDKGAATFSLDPEFFGRHPELYDPQQDIMARGVPLRPDTHLSMPIPRELNSSVLGQYRELMRWALDNGSEE